MSSTPPSPSLPPRRRAPHDSSWAPELTGDRRPDSTSNDGMVCVDPASQRLLRVLEQIAPTNLPVIITGESGTGKEVAARYIHQVSGRSGAFVAINCSTSAARLAGTGFDAHAPANGDAWFAAAHRGTLFLDELADLPTDLQSQLLRCLLQIEAPRAAADNQDAPDVRLIAATKLDLSEVVSCGHFSLDLFHRLNVGQVRLLPLRQRRGDIPPLAEHFLHAHARRRGVPSPSLGQPALAALSEHPWPGNIRELENVIRCALLLAPARELGVEHLRGAGMTFRETPCVASGALDRGPPAQTLGELLRRLFQMPGERLFENLESQIVAEAFRFSGGNQVRTAALLGISRNVLRTLLRRHGLFNPRRKKA